MKNDGDSTTRWAILGSFAAVAGAVVCCVGPVVLLALGASGAGVATLSGLEAYRPLFGVAAVGSLAVGLYRTYGPPAAGRGDSEGDAPGFVDRALLWAAALLVGTIFLWPHLP